MIMAPPALNLNNATFKSPSAISSSASTLRSPSHLSCRSPRTPRAPSDGFRPLSHSRHGSLFDLSPNSRSSPDTKLSSPSRLNHTEVFDYDDEDTAHEESPTDSTWFLPHSPGLPPLPPMGPAEDGKLGVLSAISIIVGKTMGVGAYTVPSAIFTGLGSVGMTLLVWVIGSIISFCGLAVYMDLGTAIPRSGGERVYLERIFRKPYMLGTCMFMSYVVLLGFSTPNAIVLGEHALYVTGATAAEDHLWTVRVIAVLAVSSLCYIHARHPRLGLGLVNVLGVAKVLILVIVVVSGVAGGLIGVGATRGTEVMAVPSSTTAQRNFHAIWEGSSTQPYDYATALLKVLYCFRGYSTANQVLSDVRDPVRTLKVAAPVALSLVSASYLAINVAFFLVIDKDEFRSAGVVVAGVFFRKVFGDGLGVHILPLFVVISAAGNIAATAFAQARVNEELAKEGILPAFWLTKPSKPTPTPLEKASSSSNGKRSRSTSPSKPRNVHRPTVSATTPTRGLLLHWAVSVAAIVIPPPGKLYNFLVDIGGFPVSVLSVAVSLGLLYLHNTPSERWQTPCRAPRWAIIIFAASNCLLLVLPWIPPKSGMAGDGDGGRFPSWAYPVTSLGVLGLGAVYWVIWRTTMPASALMKKSECCDGSESDEEMGESSSTAGSERTLFAATGKLSRRKSFEEEREAEAMLLLPTTMTVAGDSGACGCRACPQVRRRALCGCMECPARREQGSV